MRILRSTLTLALTCALLPATVSAAEWGDLTGKVVWAGKNIPARKVIPPVNCPLAKDKMPLLSEELVINDKKGSRGYKGVKWAVVFLAKVGARGRLDPAAKIPVHPDLATPAKPDAEADQPHCAFEPHIITLREGQGLRAKNSATVGHNFNVLGNGVHAPMKNPLIPAGKEFHFTKDLWKARYRATPIGCTIHRWMQGFVWVFPHPYFTVTDENGEFTIKNAPAGKYQLVIWHEHVGWVAGRNGKTITIQSGENKLDDFGMKP